jgi:RNA polymerase sigma factor (sigma-70 family)
MGSDDSQQTAAVNPAAIDVEALRAEHFARVVSPDVQRAIVARLKLRGMSPQDREDLAGDVTQALLEMDDFPPTTERCLAAAVDIAEKRAAMTVRTAVRGRKVAAGPTPDADLAASAVDAMPLAPEAFVHEEKHRVLEACLKDGTVDPRTAKMLALQADGKSVAQIAKRTGVSPQTVANALTEGRKHVRSVWQRHAGKLGLLVLLGLLVAAGIRARDRQAQRDQALDIRPDDSAIAPTPPFAEAAAAFRRQAKEACDEGDTVGCEIALDNAKDLDPAGENLPEVKAMRKLVTPGPTAPVPSDWSKDPNPKP